jgi:Holliday junction resolvase YEN1
LKDFHLEHLLTKVHRIYGEIGPGQRVALSKFAIDTFEKTGRPLRIAIDVSIWQFQIQSGKGTSIFMYSSVLSLIKFEGGSNPALRTLYYRLLRLLSMSIQPLFVFDGSQKPPFKRNKRTGAAGPSLTDFNTKQLLKLFGFPFHVAPGEAEAECALLQREGLVDAVLSEDVDTLMFGCGRTLRNWSSEGSRGNHAPTHVTVYDAKATQEGKSSLDREGMVLVALMSGGDYITEGIPGCGIKVACEAARAGYGKSLCKLSRTDTAGLNKWRDNLVHELQTNESKHFRIKHKALQIPETFPNKEVLGYYTHPVVSSATKLAKLKEEIEWDGEIDVAGLRVFVAEAFDWTHKTGAKKFIRGLAPALLVLKVRARANRRASGFDDPVYTAMNEMGLVREICGRRQHFSTDGIPELRLVYHPANIVGLDLDSEADESEDYGRDGLAPLGEDENPQTYRSEAESDGSSRTRSRSPTKRQPANYDPTELQKVWVPETIAKVGIPLMVEDYEEALLNPRKANKPRMAAKRVVANGGMPKGALDRYITIVKPATEPQSHQSPKKLHSVPQHLPPAYLAPVLNGMSPSRTLVTSKGGQSQDLQANKTITKRSGRPASVAKESKFRVATQKKGLTSDNPWTIAQSSSPTTQKPHISTVHISKPGLAGENSSISYEPTKPVKEAPNIGQDFITSPPSSPSPLGKHSRPISSSSNTETPLDSLRISHIVSPTKKRIPQPLIRSAVPAAIAKQNKAATQEVIGISSSPTAASRSAVALDNVAESSIAKVVPEPTQKVKETGKGKNFVMLRESLEGAWKEVCQEPASERARGRAWRVSAIEVLDMTGN